ncbi:MAG TPA: hypothetical protein VGD22_07010 [Sphingobacteriaceae bacterium]
MNLQKALRLQKVISNKFLFSREKSPVLASGDYNFSPSELVYDIFNDVLGVAIGGNEEFGYRLELLSDVKSLYITPILEYFNESEKNIVHVLTTPFELRSRKRPLEIGCSVSHRLNQIKGTLGCFVRGNEDGNTYILSNHHVLYNESDLHDNFIVQPCYLDGGRSDDAIGQYYRSLSYYKSDINLYDAAIAGPISLDINWEIPKSGKLIKGTKPAQNLQKVYKIGAESDITFGKVTSLVTNVKVKIGGQKYDFGDQIRIQGFDSEFVRPRAFSKPGDSGSLIIDYETHAAIGLLFAGNDQGVTLANPIEPVLTKLGVRF